jgi:hypothetical protein
VIHQNYKLVHIKLKKIRFAAMKKQLLSIGLLGLIVGGCSTDFDVIAPYKEIIVVDGLLDEVDSIQSVKISKAFLGEGNAYIMAQQKDSINYANVLDVKMDRIFDGQVVETFSLTRNELNNKDSGIFYYPFHVLYTTNHPLLTDGSEYKIRVTNTETGASVSSQTKIVKDIDLRFPLPHIPTIPSRDTVDLASAWTSPFNVIFVPGGNSRIYDFILRFHYREIDPSGNSTEHSIDWNFNDQSTTNQTNEIFFKFYKYDMYYMIGERIPVKTGYIRRTDSLSTSVRAFEFIVVAGSEDLQTYYQLQLPTTGIVQELPTFTTVQNGLGLFTSRIIHSTSYYPSDLTCDSLEHSQFTSDLNFRSN